MKNCTLKKMAQGIDTASYRLQTTLNMALGIFSFLITEADRFIFLFIYDKEGIILSVETNKLRCACKFFMVYIIVLRKYLLI